MNVQRIDPDEARRLLESDEGYSYLDVRTPEEFSRGHVPGAVNIPLLLRHPAGPGRVPNPEFLEQVEARFGPEERLIVGCKMGGRSMKACQILIERGFTGVVDMRGGYDGERDSAGNVTFPGWSRRGLPTSTD